MKSIHHFGDSKNKCPLCSRNLIMMWYDKDEQNGREETMWTSPDDGLCCEKCLRRITGRGPKSLQEISKERTVS